LFTAISLVASGCAEPARPGQEQAAYDSTQTRQDLDRMIRDHGDPDGRLGRLRDSLPEPAEAHQRPRRDVLTLQPGSGPRPVGVPEPVVRR
jgi:hypothetical protein